MKVTGFRLVLFAVVAAMGLTAVAANADEGGVYWVSTNGVAGATGTADDPFPTLEEALTHATDYDTIKVGPGTYKLPVATSRTVGTTSFAYGTPTFWVTNAVTIVSTDGPDETIFDGENANTRYAFCLNNANAVLSGVTVQRFKTSIPYQWQESATIELKNGLVTNCIVRDCALYYVGGINVRKGTVAGCRVSNVSCSDGLSLGAGINRTQGSDTCCITNCIVEGCSGKQGAGMLLQQPTKVYGCVVRNCTIVTSTRGQMGPLAVNHASVTVENCVITNNSGRSGGGVQIGNNGGIVRNCLIADNTCTDATGGGGVRISAGTLECCTVAGNTVDASLGAKGDGVYQTKGTIRNCIIAMNGKNRVQANDLNHYKSDGTCTYTCTYPTSVTGEGNVWEDPMFADLAGHDYRLSNLSSLFDIGSNQTWMETATDLDGNVRIKHEIVNPGCYETSTPAVKPLTCSFVADVLEGGKPLAVTFTSSVKNPGDTVEYAWSFGDGGESTEANPVHAYTASGIYDVQLVVTSGDRSFTSRQSGFIKVGTPIAYVSNTGSGTWPYDTPEKATNDVNEAYRWLYKDGENYGRLVFRDGTYSPKEVLRITRPKIRFECENGPGRVFLNGSKLKTAIYGVISIQEATAVVDGLVFTNCSANSMEQVYHGSALTISAGTATNCTIAKCYANTYTTSPLYMTGGTFTHGLIWGCNNVDSGAGGGGRAGFYMNGSSAKLIDTVVSNNAAWAVAGGQLAQGVVSNCTIVANVAGSSNGNAHGILQVGGGTAVNTKIVGNSYTPDPGGIVGLEGGTMRNCLVADNVASKATGGVNVSGAATLENCTIAGNEVKTEGQWSGLYVGDVKATIRNVLVAGNTGSANEFRLGETATVTTGLFGIDPKFRNPARGDYRFRGGSPAQNAGTNQSWMDGATDLQGNPRILNKAVDIGCYEVPQTGLTLIVR